MSVPDRKEIIRLDCPVCSGNGFITRQDGEHPCPKCGGVGCVEKSMPWRPEGYSMEEKAQLLGVQNPSWRRDKDDSAAEPNSSR